MPTYRVQCLCSSFVHARTALPFYAAHYYSPGGEPEAFPPGCRVQLPAAPLVVRVEAGRRLLENSVADPDPGSGAFLTPGSGMSKKSGFGSGMNNPDHISESLETIFWVKILKFFNADPGSGIKKIRFRDNIPDPQHCW